MSDVWTLFWDRHSGGGCKERPYESIYIEAPETEARVIFYNRFGHSPDRVSCTCCGEDYSVSQGSLDQLTAYHRGCEYDDDLDRYVEKPSPRLYLAKNFASVEDYLAREDVLAIYASEVAPDERSGSVPQSGYVWMGE